MLRTSHEMNELFTALAKAQAVIGSVSKDALNPHFGKKYASLANVLDTIRKPLADNDLALVQVVTASEGWSCPVLTTMLVHKSGQYIGGDYPLRPSKDDPQGWGSAVSYARRYMALAIVGAASDDDDDGNSASAGAPTPAAKPSSLLGNKSPAPERKVTPDDVAAAKPKAVAGASWQIPYKGSWPAWAKTILDKAAKAPDLAAYEKLFTDNNELLLRLCDENTKLYDATNASLAARKAELSGATNG